MARKRGAAETSASNGRSPKRTRHAISSGKVANAASAGIDSTDVSVKHGEPAAGATNPTATRGGEGSNTSATRPGSGISASTAAAPDTRPSKIAKCGPSSGDTNQGPHESQQKPKTCKSLAKRQNSTQARVKSGDVDAGSPDGKSSRDLEANTGARAGDSNPSILVQNSGTGRPRDTDPSNESLLYQLARLTHLPPDVQARLRGAYNVTSMRIASSSSIEGKVTQLLAHLSRIDLLDRNSRPGVVLLYADASAASKMISVIEICKRNIGSLKKRADGCGGNWYQYSRLDGELREAKTSKAQTNNSHFNVSADVPEAPSVTGVVSDEMQGIDAPTPPDTQNGQATGDESSDEDAFEVMEKTATGPGQQSRQGVSTVRGQDSQRKHHLSAGEHNQHEQQPVRAVPVMTIFMSMVRVAELEAALGEQTNARSKDAKQPRTLTSASR